MKLCWAAAIACAVALFAPPSVNAEPRPPSFPPDAMFIPCREGSDASCPDHKQLLAGWFDDAYAGGYQGQRNVAFCFHDVSCAGILSRSPTLGCAWSIVILLSGDPQVNSTDVGYFRSNCNHLTGGERVVSVAQAAAIFRDIYHRELAPFAWNAFAD